MAIERTQTVSMLYNIRPNIFAYDARVCDENHSNPFDHLFTFLVGPC